MFPGGFGMGGWWMIFPIIGFIVMVTFMFIMMGRMGFRGSGRDSRREPHESDRTETPLEILKKRYAKGEITKEEFEEMKNVL
ncbi:MAG: SHOCT domain-containing protein [Anaerolineales bacterium]